MKLEAPPQVRDITRRLEDAGHSTWAVGGAVRDALAGLPPEDWDLATAATPKQVRRLFRRTVPIGIDHGTVGVLGPDGTMYEVTTFRRDVETFGRHAVVEFAETIEEDLARRDFTCNAVAWHPLTHELRDPFGGAGDLERRLLRTVGDPEARFAEDFLRVLRALRFAGHFSLDIDAATWAALEGALPHLPDLSAERIREELWKVLGKTERASGTLALYAASGALAVLYPELDALVGLPSSDGEGPDAWTRTLLAVDAIPVSRVVLRVAALLHAVGQPTARMKDLRGGWRYTGHEIQGARAAEAVMRRLKASNADTSRVAALVRVQASLFSPESRGPAVRRFLRDVGPELLADLFRLRIALCRAAERASGGCLDLAERWRMAHAELLRRPPLSVADLAVGGADLKELGLRPGPRFGRILDALLERVLDDPSLNDREALTALLRDALAPEPEEGDVAHE